MLNAKLILNCNHNCHFIHCTLLLLYLYVHAHAKLVLENNLMRLMVGCRSWQMCLRAAGNERIIVTSMKHFHSAHKLTYRSKLSFTFAYISFSYRNPSTLHLFICKSWVCGVYFIHVWRCIYLQCDQRFIVHTRGVSLLRICAIDSQHLIAHGDFMQNTYGVIMWHCWKIRQDTWRREIFVLILEDTYKSSVSFNPRGFHNTWMCFRIGFPLFAPWCASTFKSIHSKHNGICIYDMLPCKIPLDSHDNATTQLKTKQIFAYLENLSTAEGKLYWIFFAS